MTVRTCLVDLTNVRLSYLDTIDRYQVEHGQELKSQHMSPFFIPFNDLMYTLLVLYLV